MYIVVLPKQGLGKQAVGLYSFFSSMWSWQTHTHVWSHTCLFPNEHQGITLMLGKDRLPTQTSAELLLLLVCSSLAVCTEGRTQRAASPLLPSPAKGWCKSVMKRTPQLSCSDTSPTLGFSPGAGKRTRGVIPRHLFLAAGEGWQPRQEPVASTSAAGTLPTLDTAQSLIPFPAPAADMQVIRGWRREEQIKERKAIPKTWVSCRAPLGGACLLFSVSPGSFYCPWAAASLGLLFKQILSECNTSFLTPVCIFIETNIGRKCYSKSAHTWSYLRLHPSWGREALRCFSSAFFCTVWATLPFPSITVTIPFGALRERLS